MGGLEDARYLLAAQLSERGSWPAGFTVYPYPPPQPVPPCAMILPGPDYLPTTAASGPLAVGLTPCSFAVAVTVRLVAATHEAEAAWAELDGLVEAAAIALGRWRRVDTGLARDIAGTTWLTADFTVTYPAERAAPAPASRSVS